MQKIDTLSTQSSHHPKSHEEKQHYGIIDLTRLLVQDLLNESDFFFFHQPPGRVKLELLPDGNFDCLSSAVKSW